MGNQDMVLTSVALTARDPSGPPDGTVPVRHRFDTGAGKACSGVLGRLKGSVRVFGEAMRGYNGSISRVHSSGVNEFGIQEFFVPDMAPNEVLHSGKSWAEKFGCVVLFADDGIVLN